MSTASPHDRTPPAGPRPDTSTGEPTPGSRPGDAGMRPGGPGDTPEWTPPPYQQAAFPADQPPPDSAATGPIPVVPPAIPGPQGPLTGSVSGGPPPHKHSRAGAAWVALIVAAVVVIFLLIFVMQNSGPVQVRFLGFEGTIPLGVAMAFAAVAGALTTALLGTVRILQLRARARRAAAGR
jgi:uncharacterized integral membrane protein